MGNISSCRSIYGVTATGSATIKNVSGQVSVGVKQKQHSFSAADIAYSFEVVSTAIGDVATLATSSGAVTQTTGTPTITDAGADFEGKALATASKIHAVLVEFSEVGTGDITLTSSATISAISGADGDIAQFSYKEGKTADFTLALTFSEAAQKATVTIIAKS